MTEVIQIPVKEYEAMKEEISLLKDNVLLEKMNRLVEILYEEKYGLYLGDHTADLIEAAINKSFQKIVRGMMYKQREIVLVPFPYSDLSSVKRRPVLIVSNNNYNYRFPDTLVCVITSNLFKDEYSTILNDNDLEVGVLPEQSVIKCHKLFTIEQNKILKRFSILNEEKFEEVLGTLNKLLEKSS